MELLDETNQGKKISLFKFQELVSELAESNPSFKKSVMTILGGGSYEDALVNSFTPEEVEDIINTNCGELTTKGVEESLDDEVIRTKAKFLLDKVDKEFTDPDDITLVETKQNDQ